MVKAIGRVPVVVRVVVALSLLASVLVVVPSLTAQAAGTLSLAKQGPGTVLLGTEAEFRLTATNDGAVEQYNLSFRDVLPVGVTYVTGSTSPAGAGDPVVHEVTAGGQTHQVLVWSNIADLTLGSSNSITYRVMADTDRYPVGSTFPNSASAFSSSDPREVPVFDGAGNPIPGTEVVFDDADASTEVTAVKIHKSSTQTPEGELLRGVNDHQSVYTLRVENNAVRPTSDLVVVDYIPAGMEFLGCGGPFNSTTPEYPGASNVVQNVAGCVAADAVETVSDPAGLPGGVYTRVSWTIPGSLAANGEYTIKYAAGIPQRANTTTFDGGTPAITGAQAANLDNNNGASTRETATEQSLANSASVRGRFDGQEVSDTTTHVVTAEDLRLLKSVSPSQFLQGDVATYTLRIDVSEYVDVDTLEIVDELPAGLCPLNASGNPAGLPECAGAPEYAPTNATITNVVSNPDGSFRVTMRPDPAELAANGSLDITYKARMRRYFDPAGTQPTSANDEFTNTARITGTSTPRDDVDSPDDGAVQVADESSATIGSGGPTIVKLRMKNTSPMECSTDVADYARTWEDETAFNEGDKVCFWLAIDFPDGVDTRNAELTDFLPPNVTYHDSTVVPGSAPVFQRQPATPTSYVTWQLGEGTPRSVARGSTFAVVLEGVVTKPIPLDNPSAQLKENLAKMRWTNSAGQSQSLRDAVDVPLAPPPPIGIEKKILSVNGTPVNGTAGVDTASVKGQDLVSFRVDVRNLATPGDANAVGIMAPDVWDVLPAGLTCSDIQDVSDAGQCYDQGDVDRPNVRNDATSSVIRWKLSAAPVLEPEGQARSVTYTVRIPAVISVSTELVNRAAVASYTTETNHDNPGNAVHNPAENVDGDVFPADWDVPRAEDTTRLVVPDASVTKRAVTGITESNNNEASQATIGESVTYTLRLVIPARTTVYRGALTEALPTGIALTGDATAVFLPDATATASEALPTGVTLDPVTGGLTFTPSGYTNTTLFDQAFEITLPAKVTTDITNTHGTNRTNTVSFTSTTADTDTASTIGPRTDQATVQVVEPAPTLAKSFIPNRPVDGGETVTFTLTAGNQSERPPLHDSVVVDCVPAGLHVTGVNAPAGTSATFKTDDLTKCAAGQTEITWTIGSIAGGATQVATYTAQLIDDPAAGNTYVNRATLTGSSLNDGGNQDDPERSYSADADSTVRVSSAAVVKTAPTGPLTIGEKGEWTISVTLPANVTFNNTVLTDTLPSGIDPAGVTVESVSCTGGDPCPDELTSLGTSGQTIWWLIGNVGRVDTARTITVTYTATIADHASNIAGAAKTNTAALRWNLSDKGNPTGPSGTFDQQQTGSATVTVNEPRLTIAKTVTDSTVQPGQEVTYTVAVRNERPSGNLSTAHNVVVTDTVPAGIVVLQIDDGGTIADRNPDGTGGTITWNLSSLAPNATQSFTYTAKLAPSNQIDASAQRNTAAVGNYTSLPDGGRTYQGPSTNRDITPQFPRVTVGKTVASGPAYIGTPKQWQITVTNTGNAPAEHVRLVDVLPANWTFDAGSATVSVAGGTATPLTDPAVTGDESKTLTWADLGTAPATGANRTIVVTFTATPGTGVVTTPGVGNSVLHTNTASVTAQDATGATGNKAGPYNGGPASATTRIDRADVKIVKTSGDAIAGQNLDYTLVVSNDGPDTAVGPFVVTDTLPAGLGAVSFTGTDSGWSCSLNVAEVTCQRVNAADTLTSGAQFGPIKIVVGVPSSTPPGTVFENSASVSSRTFDPNPDNNTSTVTDETARRADLALTKNQSGPAVAGQNVTYTLDVVNRGPSDSRGTITVSDTLPTGTTFVSAAGAGWICAEDEGVVTCDLAAGLAAGASASQITLVVKVPSSATGSLVNRGSVTGPETDPVPGNNSHEVTTPLTTSADLSIVKRHQGVFTPGDQGTYTFTVKNNGPSDSGTVTVTDTLPAGVTFVGDDSDDWACSAAAGTLTCTYAPGLAAGAEQSFSITVELASSLTGPIVNTATVSSPTPDPVPGNNTSTDSTESLPEADLGIVKTHTGQAVAGQSLDFSLVVTNHGPSDHPQTITVEDLLPAGMTPTSASGSGWGCAITGQLVRCTMDAGLESGDTANTITVRVTISPSAGPATLPNTALVSGELPDPEPGNNTSTDPVTVVDIADVMISKSASPTTVTAGENVTWTLTVGNDGPSDADGVIVNDPLPAGTTFVSVDGPAGWSCTGGTSVQCTIATLPAGATGTITIVARVGSDVADGTRIDNESTISTTTTDSDPDNNVDDASITVNTRADLVLDKSHSAESVTAGTQVSFTLDVRNVGPSNAKGDVTIVDTLPVGMTYVSNTGPWACTPGEVTDSGQVVTCLYDGGADLAAGLSAETLTMVVSVDPSIDPEEVGEGLANSARVSSQTTDPVPDNNTDTDRIPVVFDADLSIVKSHEGPVRVGDDLVFSLVVENAGPSTARDVIVGDELPDGLEYVDATGEGWECLTDEGAILCGLTEPLEPGRQAPVIRVTVTVLPAAYPSAVNEAAVGSSTPDSDEENNITTDEVAVPPQVDLSITKTHEPEPVQVGQQVTFTLVIANDGPTPDPGPVTVRDSLPEGLTFVSGSGEDITCEAGDGNVVTCVKEDGLEVEQEVTITIVADVGATAYPGVVNVASVTSDAEDLDSDNNTASDEVTVEPLFDLSVSKDLLRLTRQSAVWRITVTNAGPNVAPVGTVMIRDVLPDQVQPGTHVGAGWDCEVADRTYYCEFTDPLAAGQSATLNLTTPVKDGAEGTVTNTVELLGGGSDEASGKVPTGWLPDTGGAELALVLFGLLMAGAGAEAIRRRRRS